MAWGLSPSKYIVQAVKNCQLHLTEKLAGKYSIPARADNPFPVDYDPSTDQSDLLDPDCSSFYQPLIGVMRWMVELGRIELRQKFLCYLLTWHAHVRVTLRTPSMSWDIYN
jgi:hypothetical protein